MKSTNLNPNLSNFNFLSIRQLEVKPSKTPIIDKPSVPIARKTTQAIK